MHGFCEHWIRTGEIDLELRSLPFSSRMSAALLTRSERPPVQKTNREDVRVQKSGGTAKQ
jgi:hypothetical protein